MQIDEDALEVLSEVGSKTTLRYAVQLLTPSAITARIAGRQNIVRDDIKVGYIDKALSFVFIALPILYHQRLNFGMKIECCCCEQPISNQKIILTAISLGAHNNNIQFPSHNSASGHRMPTFCMGLDVQAY